MNDALTLLRLRGIRPTPQRLAVADCVLGTRTHPSADEVLAQVRRSCPALSRGTVYNTLNLFVRKGLLRTQVLRGGKVVFDPRTETHHHFIDERTGKIYDIPWDAVRVVGEGALPGFEVREYQVVMRGRRTRRRN
ncbi:MAG TPA: Fur family transcriptional regulator [Candidatus Saccharimonadales bacterium]|nr:Fur family transcriptional regulator [Candidatus Saccharimonadales bacterium]